MEKGRAKMVAANKDLDSSYDILLKMMEDFEKLEQKQ